MIRINLLAVERERTRRPRVLIPAAQRVTIGASLILLLTVFVIGWWYWSLRTQSAQIDQDIARAEAETQQLRAVLGEVQQFESRKAQLQQRVTLIEQLRRGQSDPVHLLDELSRSLPDRLWLTSLSQTGVTFTIEGRTTSLTALSDFVANLEATNWFKKPVEILDSTVEQNAKVGDLVRFSIRADFTNPEAPPPPPPAAGRRGGRR